MGKCSVFSCHFHSSKTNGIKFFSFPSENTQCFNEWKIYCNNGENWNPTKYSTICCCHFDTDSFQNRPDIKKLKAGAVPSKPYCKQLENKKEIGKYLFIN